MTARWRTVLRVQRLLRTLLANHVPLGVLNVEVDRATAPDSEGLVNDEADISGMGLVYELARKFAEQLVGEASFESRAVTDPLTWHGQRQKWRDLIEHIRERQQHARDLKALGSACSEVLADELESLLAWLGTHQPDPRPPGEPRDLLRVHDELRRRIKAAKLASETGSIDAPAAAVHDELVELLEFVLPLQGAPLPELEKFDEWLDGAEFYELMQAYRLAPVSEQITVAGAFQAVVDALRKAVRR